PERLPEPLHWFKWEAYWTWLSGFTLFVVLYYFQAHATLIDPTVASLSTLQAVGASVGLLIAAWLVYDALCRTVGRRSELALAACIVGLLVGTAYGVTHLFAARAAYLQVGAMLGTIMAANVLFVIIPAHWELIRAKEAGRDPAHVRARVEHDGDLCPDPADRAAALRLLPFAPPPEHAVHDRAAGDPLRHP